jgi:hypothetical protein
MGSARFVWGLKGSIFPCVDTRPLTPVVGRCAGDGTHQASTAAQGFEHLTQERLIGMTAGEPPPKLIGPPAVTTGPAGEQSQRLLLDPVLHLTPAHKAARHKPAARPRPDWSPPQPAFANSSDIKQSTTGLPARAAQILLDSTKQNFNGGGLSNFFRKAGPFDFEIGSKKNLKSRGSSCTTVQAID